MERYKQTAEIHIVMLNAFPWHYVDMHYLSLHDDVFFFNRYPFAAWPVYNFDVTTHVCPNPLTQHGRQQQKTEFSLIAIVVRCPWGVAAVY